MSTRSHRHNPEIIVFTAGEGDHSNAGDYTAKNNDDHTLETLVKVAGSRSHFDQQFSPGKISPSSTTTKSISPLQKASPQQRSFDDESLSVSSTHSIDTSESRVASKEERQEGRRCSVSFAGRREPAQQSEAVRSLSSIDETQDDGECQFPSNHKWPTALSTNNGCHFSEHVDHHGEHRGEQTSRRSQRRSRSSPFPPIGHITTEGYFANVTGNSTS